MNNYKDKILGLEPSFFEGLWPYFGLHLRLKHDYSSYSDQKNYFHNYDLEAYHCSKFNIAIDEPYYLELATFLKSPLCCSPFASQRSYLPNYSLGPIIFYLG